MSYLLDTNVISELRKGRRADAGVVGWLEQVGADEIFLSVLTLGEIRKGIERVRPQDPTKAQSLECWLAEVEAVHGEQILPVGIAVAQTWGRLSAKDTLPVIDSLNLSNEKKIKKNII